MEVESILPTTIGGATAVLCIDGVNDAPVASNGVGADDRKKWFQLGAGVAGVID